MECANPECSEMAPMWGDRDRQRRFCSELCRQRRYSIRGNLRARRDGRAATRNRAASARKATWEREKRARGREVRRMEGMARQVSSSPRLSSPVLVTLRCGHAHLRGEARCERRCPCGGSLAHGRRHLCDACAVGRRTKRGNIHWLDIAVRENWMCWLCGEAVEVSEWDATAPPSRYPSVDHVVPVVLGGLDNLANVRLAHLSCNVLRADGTRG